MRTFSVKLVTASGMAYFCENKDHASSMLQGLQGLREENPFCDAVLQASDFPVHRVVLSAASQYFKTMFNGSFKEAVLGAREPVVLKNIPSSCLSSLLSYIYEVKLTKYRGYISM